ncbi:hypothetical protein Vretimale_3986 [Volvox reticuliferus]|uniref:Nuclear pore complex protein n=1 Tax=Volvox reticuliferus TaxID=1737510 RepID=A0A8J4C0T6_9CHLO|nr:hypothetical protein Vretifemale_2673 [Volvox reticuliferus]GIL98776.1 hypothetical protein Vretimale_3986 [Volvox reticuliferus]
MKLFGMDIDAPVLVPPQQRQTLEDALANVFGALLETDLRDGSTISDIANICTEMANELRTQATEQLHRPARYMALMTQADEMDAHAATWTLLFYLYGASLATLTPAGAGGPSLAYGSRNLLYRQLLADHIKKEVDADVARCARVVSWLESTADEALKRQANVPFPPGEGLWLETKTEMRTRSGAMVSELDPDAPGRMGRPLHPSNAKSQERIMARVWQLLRAGKLHAAQEVCDNVGQPWRAAALGGGGLYGALPVGQTAEDYDNGPVVHLQKEELSDETANSRGPLLALWRWAARQAAAAGASEKFERAVFGALGGDAAAGLPVCVTWEDFAWVYCRSWLESWAMRATPPEAQAAADLVPGDAVMAALVRCGVAQDVAKNSVEGAMSVVTCGGGGGGRAYMTDLLDDAAAARGFGVLFAQHLMAAEAMANAGPAAVQAVRQIQALLIRGDMHVLMADLCRMIETSQRDDGAISDAAGAAGGGILIEGGGGGSALFGSGGCGADLERRQRICALAAHMLLALGALGELVPQTNPDIAFLEAQANVKKAHRVLELYTRALLAQGKLTLAPRYLCVLPGHVRNSLCSELLELYTKNFLDVDASTAPRAPDGIGIANADVNRRHLHLGTTATAAAALAEADEACSHIVAELGTWFQRCVLLQKRHAGYGASAGAAEVEGTRCGYLWTDVSENELRNQLAFFTLGCRYNREYGPYQRARVARWLAQPHIVATAAAQTRQSNNPGSIDVDGVVDAGIDVDADVNNNGMNGEEDTASWIAANVDPMSYHDLLDFVNCLCCEFALGDDVTAAAGQLLFTEVLPQGLEVAVMSAVRILEEEPDDKARQAAATYLHEEGVAEAEAAAAEAAKKKHLADRLRDLLSELEEWALYYDLNAKLSAWSERHSADSRAAPGEGAPEAEMLREGGELLQELLMRLLKPTWQQELAASERAFAATVGGRVQVTLTLTCPSTSTLDSARDPYPELQGASLHQFSYDLQRGLLRAIADRELEMGMEVLSAVGGRGHITLNLTVAPEPQLWQGLVDLVCTLLRGELEGVPPVLVVTLDADRATSLAVCRRCRIGQIVRRCAALRLSLVGFGLDADSEDAGSQLVEILAEPAGVSGANLLDSHMLELLSPAQLAQVLQMEALTYERHLQNLQERRRRQKQDSAMARIVR